LSPMSGITPSGTMTRPSTSWRRSDALLWRTIGARVSSRWTTPQTLMQVNIVDAIAAPRPQDAPCGR
jgi:hypothetical protein